uniref:Uncharacterized protein n=1 Tax=Anguilla anguilla TaxID=7936 RepID=A0A0E9SSB7_ANGAN
MIKLNFHFQLLHFSAIKTFSSKDQHLQSHICHMLICWLIKETSIKI